MNTGKKMTYSDAIELVMRNNGGFAPLKLIYREIWKYKASEQVVGRTPNNTIQERCQRDERFYKFGRGVYALVESRKTLEKAAHESLTQPFPERMHAQMQGMLLEIGNALDYDTYTSDRTFLFDGKPLAKIATLKEMPEFTFPHITKIAARVDVIWFNEYQFPKFAFEVENTTNFDRAFNRFTELREFQTEFWCVAEENRQEKFESVRKSVVFESIRERCEFKSYDQVKRAYEAKDSFGFP